MSKYKLKKLYPGLPKDWEIGMEVGLGDRKYGYSPCSGKYTEGFVENHIIKNYPEFWEEVVENDCEIIHSVKRLSDGCTFTIGDVVEEYGKIRTFLLQNNKIFINENFMKTSLSTLVKAQPLFTTEDGVDIYEGDTNVDVYYCNKNGFKLLHCCKKEILPGTFSENNLYFKSKEKAEEYILFNKPCLSIKDVNIAISEKWVSNILEKIVKNKL